MRKLLLLLIWAVVLGVIVGVVWRALVSEETRIRWRLEEMQESFDKGSALGLGDGLASDFSDKEYGMDRVETIGALHVIFL
ncbi:MAG: hypothetical protein V3T77_09625, partial [Planctomycetota bacterium]